jgi:hypothetical protein
MQGAYGPATDYRMRFATAAGDIFRYSERDKLPDTGHIEPELVASDL